MTTETRTDDLELLLGTLPQRLRAALAAQPAADLLEVVLDLGRPAQARYPGAAVPLGTGAVEESDLRHVIEAVDEFGADNRAGIEGTLHRISAIRNRRGSIVGLTLRVGRAVFGTIESIRELVAGGTSVLLLGRPGVGKTTRLREIARVLADQCAKRVIVIDTSNEIAGDGDVPHPAIGSARRMQVVHPERQHAVMIEAVENHMPEVIVIDEIGTAADVLAARTIAERGVQLIGTAHGNTLRNLLANPTLADLVGGVQTVTLGDEQARLRGGRKTVTERKAPPTFQAVVELTGRDAQVVHPDTAAAVDAMLGGKDPAPAPARSGPAAVQQGPPVPSAARRAGGLAVYPYGVSRELLARALRGMGIDARIAAAPERADAVIALRARMEEPRLQALLRDAGLPAYPVRKNSTSQIRRVLQRMGEAMLEASDPQVLEAVREAEAAARSVLAEGGSVALAPRPSAIRRLQHRVAVRHRLLAESVGSEPGRHLVLHAT